MLLDILGQAGHRTMVTRQINSLMPDTILQQILTKKPGVEDEEHRFPWHDGGWCQVLIVMRSHDLTQASVLTHNIIPIVRSLSMTPGALQASLIRCCLSSQARPPILISQQPSYCHYIETSPAQGRLTFVTKL